MTHHVINKLAQFLYSVVLKILAISFSIFPRCAFVKIRSAKHYALFTEYWCPIFADKCTFSSWRPSTALQKHPTVLFQTKLASTQRASSFVTTSRLVWLQVVTLFEILFELWPAAIRPIITHYSECLACGHRSGIDLGIKISGLCVDSVAADVSASLSADIFAFAPRNFCFIYCTLSFFSKALQFVLRCTGNSGKMFLSFA